MTPEKQTPQDSPTTIQCDICNTTHDSLDVGTCIMCGSNACGNCGTTTNGDDWYCNKCYCQWIER